MGDGRRVRAAAALGLVVLAACGAPPPDQTITLVARGMTFVADGQPDANPVLRVRAGDRVLVVFRNEAPGLIHDFAIPAWGVQSDQIRAGESTEVTFVAPREPGSTAYHCTPHAELMRGVVDVTP